MDVTQLGIWPLVSFFIPLLVAVVKQYGFSAQVNSVIALLVYVIAGMLHVVITVSPQGWTVDNLIASVATAVVVGTAAYNLFWTNLGVSRPGVPSLEDRLTLATSFRK